MSDYGSDSLYIGSGYGTPAIGMPVRDPDPTQDYIYTGPGRLTPGIPQLLQQEADDVSRNFGLKTYEAMLTDPAVSSTFLSLKLAVVSGPTKVIPAVRPKGYREGQKFNPKPGTKLAPEEQRALDRAGFCERELKRIKRSFKSFLMEISDAPVSGVKLAEKTRVECEFGPDKGLLVMDHIKVKPAWAWKFVVDSTIEPRGILTYLPPLAPLLREGQNPPSGYAIIPMDKFIRFTWMQKENDPRGKSALRAAYDWWNLKRQCMPFYYQHLKRFGSPSLDGEMSPTDSNSRPPLDPTTGKEIPGAKPVDAATRFSQALLAFQNNSVIVRPAGSALNVLEPKSDGEAFLKGFDLFDRQICLAIGLQVRASLEAKHGSKADSETAENTRGLVIAYWREELGSIVSRDWFYDSILKSFGEEDAELFTPELRVGTTEEQDKPAMITAVGGVGFQIGPSQLEELDVMLDLPERDQKADEAKIQEQMQMQTDHAVAVAQSKGGPSSPGGQGSASKGEKK